MFEIDPPAPARPSIGRPSLKVLGRHSLASVFKVALDVSFYGAILVSVVLALALAGSHFAQDETESEVGLPVSFSIDDSAYSIESRDGTDVTAEIVDASGILNVSRIGDSRILARMLLLFPVLGALILVLARLRRLFARLREGRPFDRRNAGDLRFLGFAVLVLELVWAATSYWMTDNLAAELSTRGIVLEPTFALRPMVVLVGFALLIVAEVFRQGADMKADLETARDIQFSLVPDPVFEKSPVAIHSSMVPARTVGGDYYDVVELDDGRVAFVVADVAGKGLPAALLMALLQGSLRSLLSSGLRGAELVARLNAYLVANTPGNRMVTFFYGELDPVTGALRYVNAGHNPPLLASASGTIHLEPTGVVLGVLEGAPFAEGTAQVDAGARLLLFTDGISEAANPSDEEFGDERIERVLEAHRETSPGELLSRIADAVAAFCAGAPPADDMTMMVVSRGP